MAGESRAVRTWEALAQCAGWYVEHSFWLSTPNKHLLLHQYGRRLYDHLKQKEGRPVPIGLVQIAVGGTAVELWSSSAALARCDQRRGDRMAVCQDPKLSAMYSETTYTNSTLYNSMLHPWTPLATRGAIWYRRSTMLMRSRFACTACG